MSKWIWVSLVLVAVGGSPGPFWALAARPGLSYSMSTWVLGTASWCVEVIMGLTVSPASQYVRILIPRHST